MISSLFFYYCCPVKDTHSYLVVPRWSRDGRGDDRTLVALTLGRVEPYGTCRRRHYRTASPTGRSLGELLDAALRLLQGTRYTRRRMFAGGRADQTLRTYQSCRTAEIV